MAGVYFRPIGLHDQIIIGNYSLCIRLKCLCLLRIKRKYIHFFRLFSGIPMDPVDFNQTYIKEILILVRRRFPSGVGSRTLLYLHKYAHICTSNINIVTIYRHINIIFSMKILHWNCKFV